LVKADKAMAFRAEEALKKAVARTIADHKRIGDPIVIWRDGKVVKVPADQIEVHEPEAVMHSWGSYFVHVPNIERARIFSLMRISQIVTSSDIKYAKRVHAFTEQGVAMLSSVLRSERAIKST